MKIKKETVAIVAGILISLFVLGMATYGANQMINNFFDKNVISPKGVVQTFQLQKPRLWVDKATYQKELDQEKLIDQATNEAVDHVLNATPTPKPRSFKIGEVLASDYCVTPIGCIRDVGERLGAPNKDIMAMVRIARCESNYRAEAVNVNTNKTIDRGIFQINSIHKDLTNAQAYNFESNIEYAWSMYLKQGLTPWNSSYKCWN